MMALVLLLLLAPRPVAAQGGSISLDQFQDRVQSALDLLAQAQGDDSARLHAAQDLFAEIDGVRLPSGSTVELGNLVADTTSVAQAQARLTTVMVQLKGAANDRTAQRLDQLDQVWNEQRSLWERFLRWVRSLFPAAQGQPANDLAPSAPIPVPLGMLLGGLGVMVIVGGMVYWVMGLSGAFADEAGLAAKNGKGADPLNATDARQAAAAQAGAGNYRQAVRLLYLSALLKLEEAGLVRHDRSQTNREVLSRMDPASPVAPHLRPVIGTFDAIWYGVREPDAATFEAYAHEIESLDQLVQDPNPRRQP